MTKIVPSPDWFVGLDGIELCKDGEFIDSISSKVGQELCKDGEFIDSGSSKVGLEPCKDGEFIDSISSSSEARFNKYEN